MSVSIRIDDVLYDAARVRAKVGRTALEEESEPFELPTA